MAITTISIHICSYVHISYCSNVTGGWSEQDVFMDVENSNSTMITCVTKHLTSFAVLLDSSGSISKPTVSIYVAK